MGRFIIRRAIGMILILLAMTFLVFLLRQVVPSNPARAAVGPNAPESVVEAKREELGLNDPLWVQFSRYVGQLVQGDLGRSITTRNPVSSDLARFLPASVELIGAAVFLALVLALTLALAQTLLPRSQLFRQVIVSGASAPIFLTGLLLLYILWFRLNLFPSGGRSSVVGAPDGPTGLLTIDGLLAGRFDVTLNALWHIALPALTLALTMGVAVGRTLRSSIVGVQRQDYVRTARSLGLTESRVVRRHVIRNAATGAISMTGLQIGLLFANLLIVERIFAWPGVGLYLGTALARADLTATLGVSLLFGAAYIVINTLVDITQAVADPRVSLE